MADGVTFQSGTPATPAAGVEVATDDAGAAGHVQIVKLAIAADGSATVLPGDATDGLLVNLGANNDVTLASGAEVKITDGTHDLEVNSDGSINAVTASNTTRVQVTPTISTSIYAAKDNIGGLMTFANAAATSGGTIVVNGVHIVDKDQEFAPMDLVLFRASITTPTDNAVFDPTDAELLDHIGTIPISGGFYADFNDNAVASINNLDLVATLSGTSLYGVLVARGTPTFTGTSDLSVTLTISRS